MELDEKVLINSKKKKDEKPMVSVWCCTYNQKDYIEDALKGFLSQQTNFLCEVIIYDDASTDGTTDIIRYYAKEYPEMIHPIISPVNTFYSPDRPQLVKEMQKKYLTGKYVAFCEGDDFWIDCHKLQIQVDYMEKNPQCVMYLHNAIWMDYQHNTIKTGNPFETENERDVTPEEIIMQYKAHPPTASFLCKREILEKPEIYYKSPAGDYAIQLYALTQGNIHYNGRIMSIYRWHSKGSYNKKVSENKAFRFYFYLGLISFLDKYDQQTQERYHIWVTNKIQYFTLLLINDIDRNVSIRDYYSKYKEEGCNFSDICETYLGGIELLRRQLFDTTYCSYQIQKFIEKYSHIVVMGIGNYGSIIARQFERNQINFSGFAVSHKKEENTHFRGKAVWKLSELPFDKNDTGVIVAINPIRWDDILHSLEHAEIQHYHCPFLLKQTIEECLQNGSEI